MGEPSRSYRLSHEVVVVSRVVHVLRKVERLRVPEVKQLQAPRLVKNQKSLVAGPVVGVAPPFRVCHSLREILPTSNVSTVSKRVKPSLFIIPVE